jgi:cobalt/nickel transport system permease protein
MTPRFDFVSARDSLFTKIDPRWKMAAIVVGIAGVLLLRTPHALIAALAASVALALLARLPVWWLVLRVGAVALLLLPFAVLLPVLTWGADSPAWVGIVRIYAKALAVVTLTLVLLTTSPLPLTAKAAHALHCPGILVQILIMTYRYLLVLIDEARRMRIAFRARGYRMRASAHTYRTTAHLAGTMLVLGHERAQRISDAMRCRGFNGAFRSLTTFRTFPKDLVFFSSVTLGTAALLIWDRMSV